LSKRTELDRHFSEAKLILGVDEDARGLTTTIPPKTPKICRTLIQPKSGMRSAHVRICAGQRSAMGVATGQPLLVWSAARAPGSLCAEVGTKASPLSPHPFLCLRHPSFAALRTGFS
jgi:hypothetical protein